MGFFSRKKAETGKSKSKAPQTTEQTQSTERPMYIPRYAARDGLIGAPTGYKAEEQEAFRRAYQSRMSREMNESHWSLPNPKMSPRLSRNSSSMSLDWAMANNGSSSRLSGQFSPHNGMMRAGSHMSLPHMIHDSPPVPAIPQQYASQASSVGGPTPLAHSRNSSFHNQLQPAASTSSFSGYSQHRPRMSQRQSFLPNASPLGRTPETSNEHSPVDSPRVSATPSSASSTTSDTSGEVVEIAPKADSPAQYIVDRDYPNDPRKYEMEQSTPRTYFAHATKPQLPPAPVAAAPAVKRSRFSFSRRGTPVAAH